MGHNGLLHTGSKHNDNADEDLMNLQYEKKVVRKSIKKQLWVKRQGLWITKVDMVLFITIMSIILFLWNSQASMPSWEN